MSDLDISAELVIIKNQLSHMDKVFDKVTNTLDKITELCNNSASILQLHDQRFKEHEHEMLRITTNFNSLDAEQTRDVTALHSRITTQHRELEDKMTKEVDKVLLAIQDLKAQIISKHDDLESRIEMLERWRWIILGILIAGSIFFPEIRQLIFKN